MGAWCAVAAAAGCGDDTDGPTQTADAGVDAAVARGCVPYAARLPGETYINAIITTDTTWDCDNQYRIFDTLIVDSGDPEDPAVLTITEGTIVEASVSGEFPALLVTPNGRLVVQGTEREPVVFTAAAGTARRGEWGGIFLSGRAHVNTETGVGTLVPWAAFGDRAVYGGGLEAPDDTGSCGILDYLRVEFAGQVPVTSEQPYTPALTLAGCGAGTVLDHVQIHRPLNRGIEIRGGSPVLRHVIVNQPRANDDQFDVPTDAFAWMEGYDGQGQYLVAQVSDGGIGFLGMNRATQPDAAPQSDPTFYNVSIFGQAFRSSTIENGGVRLTTGSKGTFGNVVMTGLRGFAMDVFGELSGAALASGEAGFANALLYDIGPTTSRDEAGTVFFPQPDPTPEDGVNEETALRDPSRANEFGTTNPDFEGNPYSIENPNFNIIVGAATTGATTPPAGFDSAGDFRGAIDPRRPDWSAGWTNYTPQ